MTFTRMREKLHKKPTYLEGTSECIFTQEQVEGPITAQTRLLEVNNYMSIAVKNIKS